MQNIRLAGARAASTHGTCITACGFQAVWGAACKVAGAGGHVAVAAAAATCCPDLCMHISDHQMGSIVVCYMGMMDAKDSSSHGTPLQDT